MIINLINKNPAKILLYMALSPGRKHTRKEIKEWTKMNNVPLDNSINELINLKIIEKNKNLYSLNLDNSIVSKIIEEIKEIKHLPVKVQFILLDFVSSILKLRGITKIILFGSYAKLIFSDNSDIDLAVVLEKNTKIEKRILAISEKISEKHKKEVHINFFDEKELKNKKDSLIKEIRQNGRELI